MTPVLLLYGLFIVCFDLGFKVRCLWLMFLILAYRWIYLWAFKVEEAK